MPILPNAMADGSSVYGRIENCETNVSEHPQAFIDELDEINANDLSINVQAQILYCKTYAYVMLVLPGKAFDQIANIEALITAVTEPQLYYKTQILRASALDLSGQPSSARKVVDDVLAWAEQQGETEIYIDALKVSGLIKISLIDHLGALEDFNLALTLADGMEEEEKASIGSYIALVYEYREQYDLALPYFQRAVDFYKSQQNALDASIALYGLGNSYAKLGDLERGRIHLEESRAFAEQIDDFQGVAYALKELANIDYKQGQFNAALVKLQKAKALTKEANNPYLNIDIGNYLIDVYIALNEIGLAQEAIDYANSFINNESMPVHSIRLEERRAALLAAKGNYKNAYERLVKVINERVALINEQSSKQLLQLRTQYELQASEHENELLQSVNKATAQELLAQQSRNVLLSLLLVLAAVIVILVSYIGVRNMQIRRKLQVLANEDALTGLLNRRRSMELIEHQLKLAYRHGHPLTIAILDLDHFKSINDYFGHQTGDEVLRAFGQLLKQVARSTDITGRIGGEEFVIALPHTDLEGAENLLQKLRTEVHRIPSLIECEVDSTSFSCGLCLASLKQGVTELLARADNALYQAKSRGRDRIVVAN